MKAGTIAFIDSDLLKRILGLDRLHAFGRYGGVTEV